MFAHNFLHFVYIWIKTSCRFPACVWHILSQCGTDIQVPSLHTAVASKFFTSYPSSHCILILSPFGYQASGCKTRACGISGRKQAFASEDKEKWTIIWYKKRKQRPAWADFPDDDSESWTNKQTNKQCTKELLMSELGNCRKTQNDLLLMVSFPLSAAKLVQCAWHRFFKKETKWFSFLHTASLQYNNLWRSFLNY